MVSDMTTASGEWDWPCLNPLLPTAILNQIPIVPPPQNRYNSDTLGWRWCDTRVFSTRSAYAYLLDTEGLPNDVVWKLSNFIRHLRIVETVDSLFFAGCCGKIDVKLSSILLIRTRRTFWLVGTSCLRNVIMRLSAHLVITLLPWCHGRCREHLQELWAVHDGLAQAWTLGFRRVVIDTDCLENNIADRLATLGRSSPRCGLLLLSPPADLFVLVEEEKEQSAGEPVLTQDWRVTANVVCFNLHSDSGG
ncbi:hypothetical protein V6N11_022737 [Hibiscus sabdariffa]|uniref:RNase H type-1 domain-containing protein n=1 Tax=Hibiscus sabdariffa TaxID=183260 RepID=A0ABR2TKY0_9ROSI